MARTRLFASLVLVAGMLPVPALAQPVPLAAYRAHPRPNIRDEDTSMIAYDVDLTVSAKGKTVLLSHGQPFCEVMP